MLSRSKLAARKFPIAIWVGIIAVFIAFGTLYRTSSQGDLSETYPKGFRGGACTIETEALTIGYSGYYLPRDYESSEDPIRSPYVPVQCGKVPEPATLNISIDLLYPESARDFMLGLRLVQVKMDEKENQKAHEILSIPAQQHQSGVITLAFVLASAIAVATFAIPVTSMKSLLNFYIIYSGKKYKNLKEMCF